MRSPEPDQICAWDRDHVWHPFTPMTPYMEGTPPVIARAEGFRLQGLDGHLDPEEGRLLRG